MGMEAVLVGSVGCFDAETQRRRDAKKGAGENSIGMLTLSRRECVEDRLATCWDVVF